MRRYIGALMILAVVALAAPAQAGDKVDKSSCTFKGFKLFGKIKVVDAFHGLSRARSETRRFPAIDPLESWSHCRGIIDNDSVRGAGTGHPPPGVQDQAANRVARKAAVRGKVEKGLPRQGRLSPMVAVRG